MLIFLDMEKKYKYIEQHFKGHLSHSWSQVTLYNQDNGSMEDKFIRYTENSLVATKELVETTRETAFHYIALGYRVAVVIKDSDQAPDTTQNAPLSIDGSKANHRISMDQLYGWTPLTEYDIQNRVEASLDLIKIEKTIEENEKKMIIKAKKEIKKKKRKK